MTDEQKHSPLIILTGPTGSGKTAVAMALCERMDGEIISADSMQIYRGMDIGTAKVTPEERARVRHHLIDIREPDEMYSAAQWAQDARDAMEVIRRRGKKPVVCGGTGFYLTALLSPERLAGAPPNVELREEWEGYREEHGNEALHECLREADAGAADRLHPNDFRRVIRALEVAAYEAATGNQTAPELSEEEEGAGPFVVYGMEWDRAVLYERIDRRVDTMLAAGFMDELRRLLDAGYGAATSMDNLGYRHMRPVLQEGAPPEPCIEVWKRDTRRYAKRQLTWFRHQLPVRWVDGARATSEEIAEMIEGEST